MNLMIFNDREHFMLVQNRWQYWRGNYKRRLNGTSLIQKNHKEKKKKRNKKMKTVIFHWYLAEASTELAVDATPPSPGLNLRLMSGQV